MAEYSERRILGAMRVVDAATGLPVARGCVLQGDGLRLVRNRRGDYAILDAPQLSAHTRAFEKPPLAPELKSVKIPVMVSDLAEGFLPRNFNLELPRSPDPDVADSIFEPVLIHMFPAPAARSEINWAVIRATLRQASSLERLPWGVVKVLKHSDGGLLATGMADSRGEILLVVPGILFAMPADTSTTPLARQIEVRLQAFFDAARLKKITNQDLIDGQPDPNSGYLPDPDALQASNARTVKVLERSAVDAGATTNVAAGQTVVADLLVDLA